MTDHVQIDRLRRALSELVERQGIDAKPLSRKAGLSDTAVRDILERSKNPGVNTLIAIADALDASITELLGYRVPLLGKVGAGGTILFEASPGPQTVEAPPGVTGEGMMALLVVGSSMLPVYRDGDLVYVRRDHDGVQAEYIGEECAVHTVDGGTFLKTLAVGSRPNRYTLRSFNADDMEDVEVVWASPVLFVKRRRKGLIPTAS